MNWYLIASIKGSLPKRLYRGLNESSGSHGATYGKGFYFTTDKAHAAKWGKILLVPIEALPKNPLYVPTEQEWDHWLMTQYLSLGMKNVREFNKRWPDTGDFVKSLGYDGVQVGTGHGSFYVNYNPPPMTIRGNQYVI